MSCLRNLSIFFYFFYFSPLKCFVSKLWCLSYCPAMDIRMTWIIGGPGSGKTTQSQKIARQYGYVHIDPTTLIKKNEVAREANVGWQSDNQMPFIDIIPLISAKINIASTKGVVIDGYPRSLEEAVILESGIGHPDIVIALEVDQETSGHRSTAIDQALKRPTLSEYEIDSRGVIKKYQDITAKVDSSRAAQQVFEVIQFNIDALYIAEENISKAKRFNSICLK